jgi:hypothetical protein
MCSDLSSTIRSEMTGFDLLKQDAVQNALCFKLGQGCKNARSRSGGERYGSVEDVPANDGAQPEGFLIWFRLHR